MRKQFIECNTLEQAQEQAPWAAEIIGAEGGFWAFESAYDASIWGGQA